MDLSNFEYVGGGYYREKGPKGEVRPTLHGPELLRIAQELQASSRSPSIARAPSVPQPPSS